MNVDQRTQLLYRVISDYFILFVNNQKYIVKRPSSDVLYISQLEYEKILSKHKFNGWMGENDCINHLIKIGRWTNDGNKKIADLEQFIEDQKVALYQASLDQRPGIRNQLGQAKQLLDKLQERKYSLYIYTLKGFAQTVKQQVILRQTIYRNDKLLTHVPPKLLVQIQNQLSQMTILHTDFRELARTDPWRSYWGLVDNPFSNSFVDLDADKRTLMTYSKMYDNVYENPDCPSDDVVDDDDMLDGWMILQKRERGDKKQEKHKDTMVQGLSGKYQNSTEIFLSAQSQEQVDQIHGMNSVKGNLVKKQRQDLIEAQGQVGAGKMPDEVMDRSNQSHQALKQHVSSK